MRFYRAIFLSLLFADLVSAVTITRGTLPAANTQFYYALGSVSAENAALDPNGAFGAPGYGMMYFQDNGQLGILTFVAPAPITIYGYQIWLGEDGPYWGRNAINETFAADQVAISSTAIIAAGSSYAEVYGYNHIVIKETFSAGLTARRFDFAFSPNAGVVYPGPRVFAIQSIDDSPVPEPGTVVLTVAGVLALMVARRARRAG